jgi:hypothetical protein
MAIRPGRTIIPATRRTEMEVLWTTVSYAIVASGAALAAFILAKWLGMGRH